MSEIHMALIFVGILLLVVVILVVWAGMVCGLLCVGVGDVG
jgi:ABC-type polysaccharide/polyol phosphate export permease